MYILLFGVAYCLFAISEAGLRCKQNIIPVGCYNDELLSRALPEELLNERDEYSNVYGGRMIDWNDPDYFPGFVCRCAEVTEARGYTYFGIQFYGECWSGPAQVNGEASYSMYKESTDCKFYKSPYQSCPLGIGKALTSYVYKIAPYNKECPVKISPAGCFRDFHTKPRPLPFYTLNERDNTLKNWDGHWVQWKDWNNYLPMLVCRCANAAKKVGHDIFGIQFYGECWTGIESKSNYTINGQAPNCAGKQLGGKKILPCSPTLQCFGDYCAGRHMANYVYRITDTDAEDDHPIEEHPVESTRKRDPLYENKHVLKDTSTQEEQSRGYHDGESVFKRLREMRMHKRENRIKKSPKEQRIDEIDDE